MTEEQVKNVIYGFLDGSVSYKEFIAEYNAHHYEIYGWLQDKVDQCKKAGINITLGTAWRAYNPNDPIALKYNGPLLEDKPYYDDPLDYYLTVDQRGQSAYNTVFSIVYEIDPTIKYYRKYEDEVNFFLDNVPEYVQSLDVDDFIREEIIEKLPKDISKTKLSKLCRQRIREEFGIEGNKYPHWVQSSEWPLGSDGRPAKYITKTNERGSDLVKFHFVDGGTGEEIIVEQAY